MGALDRGGTSFNLPMTLQVQVEGWTPYEVEDQWMVKARDTVGLSGWIPVRVDPDERDKVAIDWDGVRANHEQQETARREALAAQGPVGAGGQPQVPQDVMGMLSGMGIDLSNANVQFEQGPPQPMPPAQGAAPQDDTIARLERLGALRTSGVLTDEEFQQQKQRILEGG